MADTLKNLQYMTINKGMKHIIGGDKMSHFPDMRIQDDSTLYAKLLEKKRSTFDKSKFTVVGSPTITDDGVASGFSSSDYLKTLAFDFSKPFTILAPFKLNTIQQNKCIFQIDGADGWWNYVIISSQYTSCILQFSDKTTKMLTMNLSKEYSLNETYYFQLNFTGQEYSFKLLDKDKKVLQQTNYETTLKLYNSTNKVVNLGYATNGSGYNLSNGSIDLSHFTITVDGKEVFNGNKTGLDVIKPDNYEVVGSPVISEDGIASGFSTSNYIKSSQISFHNNIKMMGKYIYKEINAIQRFFSGITSNARIFVRANKSIGMWNANQSILTIDANRLNLVEDDVIFYLIESDKTSTTLTVQINDKDPVRKTVELPFIIQSEPFYLGVGQDGEDQWAGSIDLNAFKIYIDGNLVYQPTLRIPYTQSKTDEKIVDAVYRDRVQDMYEQFGYTHYYTIGDEPEKYNVEVVGSPTLVGGVASGFSSSNYLIANVDIKNSWKIKGKLNCTNVAENAYGSAIISNNDSANAIYMAFRNSRIYLELKGETAIVEGYLPDITVSNNTDYDFELGYNGTKYYLLLNNNEVWSINSNVVINTVNTLGIGTRKINRRAYFEGSIDLSQFSIEVDGKEVFRGYEPAITDAFTLATHKGSDVIDSYSDGEGTYYEVRADLVQRCVGIIPINTTEVNYPRGFRDAKNIVQVAYFNVGESTAGVTIDNIAPKAQTKDGFTIGATTAIQRNYYAEGKAVLG